VLATFGAKVGTNFAVTLFARCQKIMFASTYLAKQVGLIIQARTADTNAAFRTRCIYIGSLAFQTVRIAD